MNGPSPMHAKPPSPAQKQWMLDAFNRAMPLIELPDVQAGLSRARDLIAALPEHRVCTECLHADGAYCAKWQAEIPPEWTSRGCDAWEDQIPF